MTEVCECCALKNCNLSDEYSYDDDEYSYEDGEEPSISGGVLVGGARRLRPMGGCTDYYGSALRGGRRVKGRALVGGRRVKGRALVGGDGRHLVYGPNMGGARRVKGRALVGGCCGSCGAPVMEGSGIYRTCISMGTNKKGKPSCLKYTRNLDAPPALPRRLGPRKPNTNPWISFLKAYSDESGVPYADLVNLKGDAKMQFRKEYEYYKRQLY
jgi:hypothetical protein